MNSHVNVNGCRGFFAFGTAIAILAVSGGLTLIAAGQLPPVEAVAEPAALKHVAQHPAAERAVTGEAVPPANDAEPLRHDVPTPAAEIPLP